MNLWVNMFCVFLSAGLVCLITPCRSSAGLQLGVVDKSLLCRVNKNLFAWVAPHFGLLLLCLCVMKGRGNPDMLRSIFLLAIISTSTSGLLCICGHFLDQSADDIFSRRFRNCWSNTAASIAAAGGSVIGNAVDPFSHTALCDLGGLFISATATSPIATPTSLTDRRPDDFLSGITCIAEAAHEKRTKTRCA